MSLDEKGIRVPYLSVLRALPEGERTLIILSARLEAWPVHYSDGRDQLCLSHIKRACRFCKAGQRQRWEWYAIARDWRSREIGISAITSGAFGYCSDLQDRKDDARGMIVYLKRMSGPKSAVKARVEEGRVSEDKLPTLAYTVKDALWQLWKVPEQLALLDQVEAQQLAEQRAEQRERNLADPNRTHKSTAILGLTVSSKQGLVH